MERQDKSFSYKKGVLGRGCWQLVMETKEICMEVYREEKRKVQRCLIQSEKKLNEQFGRKMNEDMNGNRKL